MLNLKRKVIAIAILAIPAALASAQSGSPGFRTVINPEDSGYFGPVVQDNAYQAKAAAAPSASSSLRFRVVVNPEDSGYFGPVVQENAYQANAAAAPSVSSSSRFRVVTNPDDSGYRGPVDSVAAAVASPADRSGSVSLGLLGTPAQSRPDAAIKVGSATRNIYVDHLKTARIENDKGQSFTWQFDSPMSVSNFPLKSIAPSGFDAGNTQVTILHPALHTAP